MLRANIELPISNVRYRFIDIKLVVIIVNIGLNLQGFTPLSLYIKL
jgi:hypothetical protein